MKKVFVKMSLMALMVFSGLMLVSNSAQAQTSATLTSIGQQTDVKTAGTFKNGSEAANILLQAMQSKEFQLTQLAEGSYAATIVKTEHSLYSNVYESILNGVSVSLAFKTRYNEMAPGHDSSPVSPLSANDWQQIYNNLLDLLTD